MTLMNMPVGRRLALGFGFVAAILVAVSLFELSRIAAIKEADDAHVAQAETIEHTLQAFKAHIARVFARTTTRSERIYAATRLIGLSATAGAIVLSVLCAWLVTRALVAAKEIGELATGSVKQANSAGERLAGGGMRRRRCSATLPLRRRRPCSRRSQHREAPRRAAKFRRQAISFVSEHARFHA